MTVTVVAGLTRPRKAAWYPVPSTSDRVSSAGSSGESSPTGTATSVPSANGTRTASAWPPPTPGEFQYPPCRQEV